MAGRTIWERAVAVAPGPAVAPSEAPAEAPAVVVRDGAADFLAMMAEARLDLHRAQAGCLCFCSQ